MISRATEKLCLISHAPFLFLDAQVGQTCNSPPLHSAFSGPAGLVGFIRTLRGLSGGKPIGMKLCIGKPEEFAAVVHAMLREKVYPDFITVRTASTPTDRQTHKHTAVWTKGQAGRQGASRARQTTYK
jgi:hypothetical protein